MLDAEIADLRGKLRGKGYPEPVEVTGTLYVGWNTSTQAPDFLIVGGAVVSMTYEYMELVTPKFLRRDGDRVIFLGQLFRILADCPELETVYLERQD